MSDLLDVITVIENTIDSDAETDFHITRLSVLNNDIDREKARSTVACLDLVELKLLNRIKNLRRFREAMKGAL